MIRLLHLSDLHFGAHSRLHERDHARAGKAFFRGLADSDPHPAGTQKMFDLVVVTGDLAEVGKPSQFRLAHEFLRSLAGELGLEYRRFVFCPGNHDISRPMCLKAQADQDLEEFDDRELRQRIDAVKLEPYFHFLTGFYGEPMDAVAQPLGHGAFLYSFEDLRLSIAALNSCEKESHREGDHVGLVSVAQSQALMDSWHEGEVASWMKVVAVHHNPTMTVPANVDGWAKWLEGQELTAAQIAAWQGDVLGFEGKEEVRRIAEDCQVQLVLNGHHHAKDQHVWPWRGQGYAHVLSAGSLSLVAEKLPGSEPPSFRRIELDAAGEMLRARAFVWVDWARTSGEVELGAFKADPDGGYGQKLDLPLGFEERPAKTSQALPERAELASFVRTYRAAFRSAHSRWDLASTGVPQSGGAGKPISVQLDEMYVPLRLGEGYDLDKLDRGTIIEPESLLSRKRPLAISGSAGSGKTTWMRWTFRRLLDTEHALPWMLVLRDLARFWGETQAGGSRSLEAFLDIRAAEQIGSGWQAGYARRLFLAENGPTPVLLVDGWDELGPLGERIRTMLMGMMELYPRLRVAVSSRPYGEGRPAETEGFEVLNLQPLSGGAGQEDAEGEIEQLAQNFFQRCYPEEDSPREGQTERFLEALSRSRDAQALARTPLLLTMMLLISRSCPLPHKRHDLYEACIDNLLTARIELKESEGALLLHEQWRPDEPDERIRAVAALAHGLQTTSEEEHSISRRSIVVDWDQAMAELPETWSPKDKRGFLAWLAGPAGLLVDRADDKLTFVHLSFQEYLTAWYLDANVEGDGPRIRIFQEYRGNPQWRETLLLWGARIHKPNPHRLDGVFHALFETHKGIALAGYMLADGLGTEEAFHHWTRELRRTLPKGEFDPAARVAEAWAASQQQNRRKGLGEQLENLLPNCRWLEWIRIRDWLQGASIPSSFPPPEAPLAGALHQASEIGEISRESLAAGRLLCGGPAFWPDLEGVGFLNLWPSHRRHAGLQLQSLLAAGAPLTSSPEIFRKVLEPLAKSTSSEKEIHSFARNFARRFNLEFLNHFALGSVIAHAREFAKYLGRDLTSDIALYSARYFVQTSTGNFAEISAIESARYTYPGYKFSSYGELERYLARYSGQESANEFASDLASCFPRPLTFQFGSSLTRRLGLELRMPSWEMDFTQIEALSFGRIAGRALLANWQGEREDPMLILLLASCRLSLSPGQGDPDALARALAAHASGLHPLWPALARHLAHRSTDADRQLLESLAKDPDQVEEGPLRWGLRFIVRGDLMLEDGSFITLDELCDQVGLSHLHYLEDPLPRLDIDWEGLDQ